MPCPSSIIVYDQLYVFTFISSFSPFSDLEGAAEAAIERRNEGEISTVLSRCSPTTDRVLVERLNRARTTAAKK